MKVLILLYNKHITDSITYNSLSKEELIIFDNSESDLGNQIYCQENNITYYTLKKNVGLSRAYNFIFDTLINEKGYLAIFDDDTKVESSYINHVQKMINNDRSIDIVVPKIISMHNNKVYSPRIKKKIYAINSGLVIKDTIYKNYRYNEKMFLYFCDLDFFDKNNDKNIMCIDYQIFQNFSEFESKDLNEKSFAQLLIRKNDAKKYFAFYKYYPYLIIFILTKLLWYKDLKVMKLLRSNSEKNLFSRSF